MLLENKAKNVLCECLVNTDPVVSRCHEKIIAHTKLQDHSLFHASGRISGNIGENIFRSYGGTTSENTDFHVLVAWVNCACLTTRWKNDVIYLTFLALDVIL